MGYDSNHPHPWGADRGTDRRVAPDEGAMGKQCPEEKL